MPTAQSAVSRVVQGTAATIPIPFVDQFGEPRVPGHLTVEVTDSAGLVLYPAGTPTSLGSDNYPQVTLTPDDTADLDLLTISATEIDGATINLVVEIIGGRYFSVFDARSSDNVLRDVAKYPDEDILRLRGEVEVEMERITGRSFVPRFRADHTDASDIRNGSTEHALKLSQVDVRDVRWLKVNGFAYAATYWELDTSGRVYFGRGVGLLPNQVANGPRRGDLPVLIDAGYEYGCDQPPDDLKRAMLTRLRSRLIRDNGQGIPDRATSMTADGNTYSLSTPGMRGAITGIPAVDEVYNAYMRRDWAEDFVGSLRIY